MFSIQIKPDDGYDFAFRSFKYTSFYSNRNSGENSASAGGGTTSADGLRITARQTNSASASMKGGSVSRTNGESYDERFEGDTSASWRYNQGRTIDNGGANNPPPTNNSDNGGGVRSFSGVRSTTGAVNVTLGGLDTTTNVSGANYTALTTRSFQVNSTLSSWTSAVTTVAFSSKITVSTPFNTSPNFVPLTYRNTTYGPDGSLTVSQLSHLLSPLFDTYFWLGANIVSSQYKQPIVLWTCKAGAVRDGETRKLLFSEIYDSVDAVSYIIRDYRKFSTSMAEVTVHSKGTSFTQGNSKYVKTFTQTKSIDGCVTGLITLGGFYSTVVGRALHTIQLTGISDYSFTSTTVTGYFDETVLSTFTYFDYLSVETFVSSCKQRFTKEATILISKYTKININGNNSTILLGLSTTTSSYWGTLPTTTEGYRFPSSLNSFIRTANPPDGQQSGAGLTAEYYTNDHLNPVVSAFRNSLWYFAPFNGFTGVGYRARVYPKGYVGWGAGYSGNLLNPYVTVSGNLLEGSEFPGRSLMLSNLETVKIHDNLTMFPIKQPLLTFTLPKGIGKYVSTVSTFTDASVNVTWTSTSSSAGSTGSIEITVSRTAKYRVAPSFPILGDFFTEGILQTRATSRVVNLNGLGGNVPDTPWSITLNGHGQVSWTAYSHGDTRGDKTTFRMDDAYSTFTLANVNAIVFSGEPIFEVYWGREEVPHYHTRMKFPKADYT